MPPPSPDAAATIRYLTRLLAACCLMHPEDTLRIPQGILDRVKGESSAADSRLLFEDYDDTAKEVVLRFRTQSLATYLIAEAPSSQQATQPAPALSPQPTTSSAPSSSPLQQPGVSHLTQTFHPSALPKALSDEQLAKAEQTARQERLRRALAREKQSRYSNESDRISFD